MDEQWGLGRYFLSWFANSVYTRLLLGLGLAEFSMHPATLLEIKKIVRDADLGRLTRFARDVLRLRDTHEIHALVEKQSRL